MQTRHGAESWPNASSLPRPPGPAGAYRPVVIRGNIGFVSGQFPLSNGVMTEAVRGGGMTDLAGLKSAARLAALNVAAQILEAIGSWDRFAGLCRVDGIIAAREGFADHAAVLDGASETFVSLFGPEYGAHARSVFAAPSLPGNAAIELVVTFALNGNGRGQPGTSSP